MPKIDKVELLAGLLVIAFGTYFFLGSQEYRMGTVQRMGPGFVPYVLGAISLGLGVLIIATGLGRTGTLPRFSLRAAAAVLGAILVFALLLQRVGLVPSAFLSVVVAMAGNTEVRPSRVLITATAISVVCWVLFIAILGLQMRPFRMPL